MVFKMKQYDSLLSTVMAVEIKESNIGECVQTLYENKVRSVSVNCSTHTYLFVIIRGAAYDAVFGDYLVKREVVVNSLTETEIQVSIMKKSDFEKLYTLSDMEIHNG